jgi:hypothetical protein
MCECGAVVEYRGLDLKVGGWNPPWCTYFSSCIQPIFIGKYTSIYRNLYVKIPRHTKLRKNLHLSMGMCM